MIFKCLYTCKRFLIFIYLYIFICHKKKNKKKKQGNVDLKNAKIINLELNVNSLYPLIATTLYTYHNITLNHNI